MLRFSRIAWRNVTRNKRRSLITLATIATGLASIIVFFGLSAGFHSQWVRNSVRVFSGHIVVNAAGYDESHNINRNIRDVEQLADVIKGIDSVEMYAPRIHINALLSTPRSSTGVVVRGIDIALEAPITEIDKRMVSGSFLTPDNEGDKQILLGYKLAEHLNARVGDKVVLMCEAADGSIGAELFRLQGIFKLGAIDLDKKLAITSLEDIQDVAVLPNRVTEFTLIVNKPEEVERIARELDATFAPLGYEAMTWDEVLPQVKELISLSDVFVYILLIIVLIVVSLGILNTMLMSIMERTREFGIMRALGTRPGQIVRMVMLESVMLGFIGSILGILLGVGINAALSINGIDLSNWGGAMELMASLRPVVYPQSDIDKAVIAAAATFATTLLASIYPAVRAARLKPVQAIRSA